jgi:hypothetical protein
MSTQESKKLFGLVTRKLSEIIEKGEQVYDPETKTTVNKEAAPAYYAQAINLLKHVGENGKEGSTSLAKKLAELAVPFADPDEESGSIRH